MSGTVELGSRGARGRDARIVAVWLGPHVDPLLELQVAAQYPQVPIYRDEELMLAGHPLTGQPIFDPPRFGPRPRMVGV